MPGTGDEVFSRNFLCLIGNGDATPPEQGPRQQLREDTDEEVDLNLALSLGGRFGRDTKGDKPVEVPAPAPALPALPRASSLPVQAEQHAARLPASGSPSSASLERGEQRWQGSGTLMRTSSLPAATDAAGKEELKKNKQAQCLKRQEVKKKMIERRNSACSTAFKGESFPAKIQISNWSHRSTGYRVGNTRKKIRTPAIQADYMFSANPTPPYQQIVAHLGHLTDGTAGTEEQSSSSSVPSSHEASRRVTVPSLALPPSSLAPRTASEATLGSSSRGDGDQSILGSRAAAAARANSTGDDVGRRLMQEMPAVHTRDLPNGNRVDGFLYKYRQADDVRIVCICHGSFFTPSEFVEHAGAGKVDHPLRHIAVSTNQTL